MLFIRVNLYRFLATLTDNDETLARNRLIVDICDAIEKRTEKIIGQKSPRSRAKSWSNKYSQSRSRLTFDSLIFNLMTGKQQLPARPRDLRLNLQAEEKGIKSPELSDAISRLVRLGIVEGNRVKLPLPRGRPTRVLSEESRGRYSYYRFSDIKNLVDAILNDPISLKRINDKLIQGGKLYNYLKYAFETAFNQAKQNEEAFLNTFRPYAIRYQQLELNRKSEGAWIKFRDMPRAKLKQLAGLYAEKIIKDSKKNNIPLIYEIFIIGDIFRAV
jgi:hypothetical protein